MTAALSVVFLFSGAAALLFETLWFRQAGLTLGNNVWASSLVTASFMGGLALGNGLSARYGERLRRPILGYALLEAIAGDDAMANRNYLEAERDFSNAQLRSRNPEKILQWRILALSMAGETERAKTLIESAAGFAARDTAGWAWLCETFSLPNPFYPK